MHSAYNRQYVRYLLKIKSVRMLWLNTVELDESGTKMGEICHNLLCLLSVDYNDFSQFG